MQPDSRYVHCEGLIQTAEGQAQGHVLNLKNLVTLQTIARLIIKAFVEGMGKPDTVTAYAPYSWATNDADFARRIMKVMTDMGVRADLLNMVVANNEESAICDEEWSNFSRKLTGLARAPAATS